MGYTFMVPAKIISGENVIAELGSHIEGKGTKALIVTDEFMVKFGNVAKVEAALKAAVLIHAATLFLPWRLVKINRKKN